MPVPYHLPLIREPPGIIECYIVVVFQHFLFQWKFPSGFASYWLVVFIFRALKLWPAEKSNLTHIMLYFLYKKFKYTVCFFLIICNSVSLKLSDEVYVDLSSEQTYETSADFKAIKGSSSLVSSHASNFRNVAVYRKTYACWNH